MEKGTKIALILIIIIMFGIVGAGGWYLGTKYANHEQKTNNKQPEKKDEEPKESNEPKLSLLSPNSFISNYRTVHPSPPPYLR